MNIRYLPLGRTVLFGLSVAVSSTVFSQDKITIKSVCTTTGSNPVEIVSEGRGIQVSNFTCKVEGGPLDGGELTGMQIYDFQGANGVVLMGGGVVRKAGGAIVYQTTEGKIAVTMTDGKPTGFTASGKGVYKAGYGPDASPYAGKTYTYTVRATGPGQSVIESKND